jgi:hypothetical protein
MYNSCGGVVLCDGGRKQAAASGIGVQWGRHTDKGKFTCTGMEYTSCSKMTLRYEKSIVQNLPLFLGWFLVNDETSRNALKTTKECKNILLVSVSVYEKEHFFVWMFADFARMSFLTTGVFGWSYVRGEKKPISVYLKFHQKAHVINPGFPRGEAGDWRNEP